MTGKPITLSVVVPAYNESAGIEQFHHELLLPELEKLSAQLGAARSHDQAPGTRQPFEIIYVNDGSTDDTRAKLQAIAEADPRVSLVNFSRNFGKEVATTAGIECSHGDAVIAMDADGQHPPAYLGEFLNKWLAGAQVVVGVRDNNQGGVVKSIGSTYFYRILNLISDSQTVPGSTDFRLIDRGVVAEFRRLQERNRITRGLIDWLGFEREYVHFAAPERIAGEATYSVRKLFGLALNSFTTMSVKPLFAFGYIGAVITFLAFVAGLTVIIEQLIMNDPLGWNFTGSAMLGILVTFLVGLILTAQGVVTIYLSHIYVQAQGRPLYVIDRKNSRNL